MAWLETNETIHARAVSDSPSAETTGHIGVAKNIGIECGDVVAGDVDKTRERPITAFRRRADG